jgi:PAS domain-containing protein
VFPVELRTYLVRDETGQRRDGMWAIVRDITERKAAEAALARQRGASYRLIVETAQEGIWIIDETESRTTFVNAHMAAMLGYTVEEMQRPHACSTSPMRRAAAWPNATCSGAAKASANNTSSASFAATTASRSGR